MTDEEKKKQRNRNLAIAGTLVFLAAMFYISVIVRVGESSNVAG